jgi:hypothetical protein
MIDGYTNQYTMPTQKVARAKRTNEWRKKCVDAVIGRSHSNTYLNGVSRVERMKSNYDLYNGVYDYKDIKHVTNPFNVADGFPAKPQEVNLIKSKIDVLYGEESKRPRNIRVIHSNQDVVSQIQQVKKDLVLNTVAVQLMQQMGMDSESMNDPDVMSFPQIEQYVSSEYQDVMEITAYHLLNYLYNKLDIDHEFMKNFKDALIAGEEIGYVGIQNGEPVYERVNPIFFEHDISPDLEFIEDGDWAVRSMWMTPQEIYDRFFDRLNPRDLDELLELNNGVADGTTPLANEYISYRSIGHHEWLGDYNVWNNGLIRVWHAVWRSFKKVGFLTYVDEMGEEQTTVVDESYKPQEGEQITWDWVIEIWEGYKAGHEKYFGIQPVEYQAVSLDNPNSQRLPYCGVMYSNTNSRSRSLVDIMKSLQYFYIILWYRLELMLARDNGKAFLMDINQIPKTSGMTVSQWMHYLKSFGIIFVNPNEQLQATGRPASFNTFTDIDMSMSNIIEGYIQLMDRVEKMMSQLVGVTPEREGDVSKQELVGNVERSVIQSAHITEWLFWTHNKFKRNVLSSLLNTAKYTVRTYNKRNLHYVMDDALRVFLEIPEDFEYADFDVFLSDTTKEDQRIKQIQSLLQPALQQGASLLDGCDIILADNVTVLKKKIQEIEARRQQMMKQEQEAQAQMAQQQEQSQQQIEQFKAENELRIAQLESETKLQVAQIQANSKLADLNRNGIADILEAKKVENDRYRADVEARVKMAELDMRQRESNAKVTAQELDIEAKAEQALIDREIAAIGLREKQIDAAAQARKAEADMALAGASMQEKAIDVTAKKSDLQQKYIDLDIKAMEREIKRAELAQSIQEGRRQDAQVANDMAKTRIMAQEADDSAYIEAAKLMLERAKMSQEKDLKEEELDIKKDEMEAKKEIERIKLQGEKIKIEQTKAQIAKGKADVVKAQKMQDIKSESADENIAIAEKQGTAKIKSAEADKKAAAIKASIPKPKKSKV